MTTCSDKSKGHYPLKVIFRQRWPSSEGRLPSKVVFYRRSSPTEVCLPPKVVFHRTEVVSHRWSSSTDGHLRLLRLSSYLRLSNSVLEFDNLNTYAGTISLGWGLIIWTNSLGQMSKDIDPVNLSVFNQWEGKNLDMLVRSRSYNLDRLAGSKVLRHWQTLFWHTNETNAQTIYWGSMLPKSLWCLKDPPPPRKRPNLFTLPHICWS